VKWFACVSILVIQHDADKGLGLFASPLASAGLELDVRFAGHGELELSDHAAVIALPGVADRPAAVRATVVAAATPKSLGTIEWSGKGGDGRRSYVVMSNGSVRPQGGGQLPPGAIQWTRRGND